MDSNLMTLEEIERLIQSGASVQALEGLIDHLPIEPDEKSALWLRAWCQNQRSQSQAVLGAGLPPEPPDPRVGSP